MFYLAWLAASLSWLYYSTDFALGLQDFDDGSADGDHLDYLGGIPHTVLIGQAYK